MQKGLLSSKPGIIQNKCRLSGSAELNSAGSTVDLQIKTWQSHHGTHVSMHTHSCKFHPCNLLVGIHVNACGWNKGFVFWNGNFENNALRKLEENEETFKKRNFYVISRATMNSCFVLCMHITEISCHTWIWAKGHACETKIAFVLSPQFLHDMNAQYPKWPMVRSLTNHSKMLPSKRIRVRCANFFGLKLRSDSNLHSYLHNSKLFLFHVQIVVPKRQGFKYIYSVLKKGLKDGPTLQHDLHSASVSLRFVEEQSFHTPCCFCLLSHMIHYWMQFSWAQ